MIRLLPLKTPDRQLLLSSCSLLLLLLLQVVFFVLFYGGMRKAGVLNLLDRGVHRCDQRGGTTAVIHINSCIRSGNNQLCIVICTAYLRGEAFPRVVLLLCVR